MWSLKLMYALLLLIPGWKSAEFSKPCSFLGEFQGNPYVECGQLEVPENHDTKTGAKITITYVVLKSKSPSKDSYPMIYLSGGPGGASLGSGALKQWFQNPLREHRDLIIFDQRGINHSSALPNMEQDIFEVMASDASMQEEQKLIAQVMSKYKQLAKEQGFNLANYNSFQNAHDVGALMAHLGYPKYNLMGGSYGTRLARVIQDAYPQFVHSVILNSPNPLGDDFLVSRLNSYALALNRIFDYCLSVRDCRDNYPNLRADYLETVDVLKNNPLPVPFKNDTFYVNAQDAIYLLRRALYGNDSRDKAPALIQAFKNRTPEAIQEVLAMELQLIGSYNSTMWISVERYETFDPRYTSKVVDSLYETLPLFPEKLGMFTSLYLGGRQWHDAELPVKERTFKSSDIPTIIMVNRYDPVTPPINGKIMQKQLTNSQLFIMDEGGHGGGDWECRVKVMNAFMNAPNAELDTSCLNLFHE